MVTRRIVVAGMAGLPFAGLAANLAASATHAQEMPLVQVWGGPIQKLDRLCLTESMCVGMHA